MKKQLLIIDLQKQFADKNNQNKNYQKCLNFIAQNRHLYDNVIATVFTQNKNYVNHNPNYKLHLGWNECKNTSPSDLEFDKSNVTIIAKSHYGTYSQETLKNIFGLNQNDSIDIIGCDSDACVMAICFSLWDNGYTNIRILSDYIYTTSENFTNDSIIKVMKRNFGNCVI